MKIWEKIELTLTDWLEHHKSKGGKFFGYLLIVLITISTVSFMLETTSLDFKWHWLFRGIEVGVLAFFAVEYVLRVIMARDKKKFIFSPLGIIDLLVVLPFFFHFLNLSFLRGFRIFRILQVLKVIRYSEVMTSFFKSFRYYKDEIRIFALTFFLVLILSSFGLYYFEHVVNPEFGTIPNSLWLAVVTMTTVGYGDMVPMTVMGKVLAVIIMFLGLLTFAIMTAIVTKIFIDHFFGKRLHHCSFCHYPHHDHDAKFCKNCGEQLDVAALERAEHVGRKI